MSCNLECDLVDEFVSSSLHLPKYNVLNTLKSIKEIHLEIFLGRLPSYKYTFKKRWTLFWDSFVNSMKLILS